MRPASPLDERGKIQRRMRPASPLDERGELPPKMGMTPYANGHDSRRDDLELRAHVRDTLSREFQSLGDRMLNDVGERVLHTVKLEFRRFMLDFVVDEDGGICASLPQRPTSKDYNDEDGDGYGSDSDDDIAGMAERSFSLAGLLSRRSRQQVKKMNSRVSKVQRAMRTTDYGDDEDCHWAVGLSGDRESTMTAMSQTSRVAPDNIVELAGNPHSYHGRSKLSVNAHKRCTIPEDPDAESMCLEDALPGMNQVYADGDCILDSNNLKENEKALWSMQANGISRISEERLSPRKSGTSAENSEDHREHHVGGRLRVSEHAMAQQAMKFMHRQYASKKIEETMKAPQADTPCNKVSMRESRSLDMAEMKSLRRFTCCDAIKVFLRSEYFDYIMGFFLMANAIQIGFQVNYMSQQESDKVPMRFLVWDWVFCGIFSFELGARIYLARKRFFYMKGWQWNLFDTVVVSFQIVDELAQVLLKGTSAQAFLDNLDVLRMLRLARIVRLIRMVRLIPELKSMVCLISASMWSFFWTVVLLSLMMFCFAVYYTDMATYTKHSGEEDKATIDALQQHWGSVGTSVLSLYMAITGGDDWRNFTDVFMSLSSYTRNTLLFSLYISFSTLVMLNLVTGVFVEGAQRIIKEDKDNELIKQVCRLFMVADTDCSQDISWQEFSLHLEDKRMDEYFKAVDLSRGEAKNLFKLLDVDGSNSISVEEFVRGCLRLRGPARSVDLAALVYDFKQKHTTMRDAVSQLDNKLSGLNRLLKKQVHLMWSEERLESSLVYPATNGRFEEVLV